MASWHRVGQRVVVCKNKPQRSVSWETYPVVNSVYTIRSVTLGYLPGKEPIVCFILKEICNPAYQYWQSFGECEFSADCFVPCGKRPLSVFKHC